VRYMLTGDLSTDWNRDPYLVIADVSDPLNISFVKRFKLVGD